MPLIVGVDSSTRSTKVEVRDLASGELIAGLGGPGAWAEATIVAVDPGWRTRFAELPDR